MCVTSVAHAPVVSEQLREACSNVETRRAHDV
jgi:hypothetical protein